MNKEEVHRLALATLDRSRYSYPPANAYEFWQAMGGRGQFCNWKPPFEVQRFIDMAFPTGLTKHESILAPSDSLPNEPFAKAENFDFRSGASTRR